MGKNILYVTNYYLEDVIAQRHSEPYISQAGQNKGKYIIDLLKCGGNHVTVWSNAWTNSHSFRFYKGFQSKLDSEIYYADIMGIPGINAYTCLWSSKRFLKKKMKEQKFDAIIFYNMRLENSRLALWAKRKYKLPIILQYEDGLTNDANVSGLKRKVYGRMEKEVLGALDGAFLVNSKIKVPCPSVVIRGAIRKQPESDSSRQTGAQSAQGMDPAKGQAVLMRDGRKPRFLFSSTLDRQRGIEVVLEALKYTDNDFILSITGRGEAEGKIAECRDERIRFPGYLDYETYQKELAQADICINAQLAHHEFGNFSFPSKIFEYLSAGKLVVSWDVADAEVALGDTLLIYHEDDPKKLAQTIDEAVRICQDEASWEQYQKKIQKVIRENSMESIAAQVNELLMKIEAPNKII